MTPACSTCVAQLTPRGRGAIASVLIRGPEAIECVDRLFRPHAPIDWRHVPMGRVLVGRWQPSVHDATSRSDRLLEEELVVCRTGADRVEVHCHGGTAAVSAVIDSLRQWGCREVAWPELLGSPEETPIRRAARRALATARTQRVAAILLDQFEGALDEVLQQIGIALDRQERSIAARLLADLLRYATIGPRLTTGFRVAIAGLPNVGKSSLINAIMGFQRALVVDQPGTTRDIVTAQTALDGWPVELADTAGIRAATEPLEAAGVLHAQHYLASSDLVVLVLDATCPRTAAEQELLAQYENSIVVVNKCDLVAPPLSTSPEWWRTSARTGAGLEQLLEGIARRLVPHPPVRQTPVPFEESQVHALRQAHAALQRGDCLRASQQITRLLRD